MATAPVMSKEYITRLNYEFEGEPRTSYRIGNTRISLDLIVYAWREGESPESLVESYPSLTLEQVHGALAFYFANREHVDEYLHQGEIDSEKLRVRLTQEFCEAKPELYQRLQAERQRRGLIAEA
jgi:uncharacterized protein (DUF433 family)